MAEYIEREAARAKLILNDELHAADLIKSIPATDVRPVVRGKWKTTRTILGLCCICSVCESCANTESRFCPYCGADMREA